MRPKTRGCVCEDHARRLRLAGYFGNAEAVQKNHDEGTGHVRSLTYPPDPDPDLEKPTPKEGS